MFLIILLFYKLYIAIINHKQVLCLARKNDSLMILQYSYILVIIFIIKGRRCKKENMWWTWTARNGISKSSFTNSVSISFFLFFPLCHIDLSLSSESSYGAESRHLLSHRQPHNRMYSSYKNSHRRFRPCRLDSRLFKKYLQSFISAPCMQPLLTTSLRCSM